MSRAEKWLRKQKQLNIRGRKVPMYCQHCKVPVDVEVYEMEQPWEYQCKMCGKYAFEDLKIQIEKNRAFNLSNAIKQTEKEKVE